MLKKIIFLVCIAAYTPLIRASEQKHDELAGFTLASPPKDLSDNVKMLRQETALELATIGRKVQNNAMIMCVVLSKSPTFSFDISLNTSQSECMYKKYILEANNGMLDQSLHAHAQQAGYEIVKAIPSHIIVMLCQYLQHSQEKHVLCIAINKIMCSKCHYLLQEVIGFKKKTPHIENGCQGKALAWPIPQLAMQYINSRIQTSPDPLTFTQTLFDKLLGLSIQNLQATAHTITQLRNQLVMKENTITNLNNHIALLQNSITSKEDEEQKHILTERDNQIILLRKELEDAKETLKQKTKTIQEQDQHIASLQNQLENKESTLKDENKTIQERDSQNLFLRVQIEKLEKHINDQDKTIQERDSQNLFLRVQIKKLEKHINDQDKTIQEQKNQNLFLDFQLKNKQVAFNKVKKTLAQSHNQLDALQDELEEKRQEIQATNQAIIQHNQQIRRVKRQLIGQASIGQKEEKEEEEKEQVQNMQPLEKAITLAQKLCIAIGEGDHWKKRAIKHYGKEDSNLVQQALNDSIELWSQGSQFSKENRHKMLCFTNHEVYKIWDTYHAYCDQETMQTLQIKCCVLRVLLAVTPQASSKYIEAFKLNLAQYNASHKDAELYIENTLAALAMAKTEITDGIITNNLQNIEAYLANIPKNHTTSLGNQLIQAQKLLSEQKKWTGFWLKNDPLTNQSLPALLYYTKFEKVTNINVRYGT